MGRHPQAYVLIAPVRACSRDVFSWGGTVPPVPSRLAGGADTACVGESAKDGTENGTARSSWRV